MLGRHGGGDYDQLSAFGLLCSLLGAAKGGKWQAALQPSYCLHRPNVPSLLRSFKALKLLEHSHLLTAKPQCPLKGTF